MDFFPTGYNHLLWVRQNNSYVQLNWLITAILTFIAILEKASHKHPCATLLILDWLIHLLLNTEAEALKNTETNDKGNPS